MQNSKTRDRLQAAAIYGATATALPVTLFLRLAGVATLLSAFLAIASCGYIFEREPGIGKQVDWTVIPQWERDDLAQAWAGMQAQCPRMTRKSADWEPICESVSQLQSPSTGEVRAFFEKHFALHRVHGKMANATV